MLETGLKLGFSGTVTGGTWVASTDSSSQTDGYFCGWSPNGDKGRSIYPIGSDSTIQGGWRVLEVDRENKIVTLIHAGVVSKCTVNCPTNQKEFIINSLNDFCSRFINPQYATSGRCVTKEDIENLNCDALALGNGGAQGYGNSGIRNFGGSVLYWLATLPADNHIFYQYTNRTEVSRGAGGCINFGTVRPVVTLKSEVFTEGKTSSYLGVNGCWTIEVN